MQLVGRFPYRFIVRPEEQFFRRISFETASGNVFLQLFLLKVNTIVLVRYQLYLICIKDEHLDI